MFQTCLSKMNDIIPIFYDHSSFKSILTFAKIKDVKKSGPKSIVQICKENNLKKCVFVSKQFFTFDEALKNCKSEGVELIFGLEFVMCDDAKIHTEESITNEHKIIIFLKNGQGYEDLLRIYSACHANIDNKYYVQRFDYKQLKPLWTDNLLMALPFFDSFVAKNLLQYGATIVPDLSFVKPTILREKNSGIPFAPLIDKALDNYNVDKSLSEQSVKTIYYAEKKDFAAYNVYRAILNKSSFMKPQLDHFSSTNFSFENYKECSISQIT